MWTLLYDALAFILLCPYVLGFFWDGCPCCGDCEYCQDTWTTHTIGTDVNAGGSVDSCVWTETAGSWTIAASNLLSVSSADAFLSTPDASDGLVRIVVSFNATTASDRVRIFLDYQDSSNYLYAEVKVGNIGVGYIKTGQVSGGVDSTLHSYTFTGTSILAGNNYYFTACLDAGRFHATVSDTLGPSGFQSFDSHYNGITPTGGGLIGIGTGSVLAGTMRWSQTRISYTNDDCPACANCCEVPSDSVAAGPLAWMVTFAGIANGACGTCTSFNAAFVCDLLPGALASNCIWEIANTNCGATVVRVRRFTSGTEQYIEGRVVETPTSYFKWEVKVKDNSPVVNLYPCEGFVATALNVNYSDTWGDCDTTAGTATLDAVVT